ncbi:DUF87 domain-containing protein, partial [Patescibacteria group bacterium]|nr:DUF87 domain-containing protein [Patescibacteria group bacterium]
MDLLKKGLILIFVVSILISSSFITSAEMEDSESAFGNPIVTEQYEISRSWVKRIISEGRILQDNIIIKNLGSSSMSVSFMIMGGVEEIISLSADGLIIEPYNYEELTFQIVGLNEGEYTGHISLTGGVSQEIPVLIKVRDKIEGTRFLIEINSLKESYLMGEELLFLLNIRKLIQDSKEDIIEAEYYLKGGGESFFLEEETLNVSYSTQIKKTFEIPKNVTEGVYNIELIMKLEDETVVSKSQLKIILPFWLKKFLGIPLWIIITALGIVALGIGGTLIAKKILEKKKKYKMKLEFKTIPKAGERSFYLGKIAETNTNTYYNMDDLTTHMVVAGATGGGKSISAQVFVEEALKKNIAVVV